ncbi:hypothetical protein ACLB2K_041731 [Fragaria x ananassa]
MMPLAFFAGTGYQFCWGSVSARGLKSIGSFVFKLWSLVERKDYRKEYKFDRRSTTLSIGRRTHNKLCDCDLLANDESLHLLPHVVVLRFELTAVRILRNIIFSGATLHDLLSLYLSCSYCQNEATYKINQYSCGEEDKDMIWSVLALDARFLKLVRSIPEWNGFVAPKVHSIKYNKNCPGARHTFALQILKPMVTTKGDCLENILKGVLFLFRRPCRYCLLMVQVLIFVWLKLKSTILLRMVELFEKNFPGNFVAGGLDQIHGWFYTLVVLSTALFGKSVFQNLICNGLVLAEDGKKSGVKVWKKLSSSN